MDSSLDLCRLSTWNVISVDFLTKLGNANNIDPIITSFGRWFGCNTEIKNRILCIRWFKESPTTLDLISYIVPHEMLIEQRDMDESYIWSNEPPNPKPRFITHIDKDHAKTTSCIHQQISNWCKYVFASLPYDLTNSAVLSATNYLAFKTISDEFSLLFYKKRGFSMSFRTFNQERTIGAKPFNTDHQQTNYDIINWTDVHWGNDKNGFSNGIALSATPQTVDFGLLFGPKVLTKRCIDSKLFQQLKLDPYFNSKSYNEYGYVVVKLVTAITAKQITAYEMKKCHNKKFIAFYEFYDDSRNLQFLVFITCAYQLPIEKATTANPFILSRYYTLDKDAVRGVVFVGDPRISELKTSFVFSYTAENLKFLRQLGQYRVS